MEERETRQGDGGAVGSFEAWLLMRGMRTLHVRIKRQSDTAMALALATSSASEGRGTSIFTLYSLLSPGHFCIECIRLKL